MSMKKLKHEWISHLDVVTRSKRQLVRFVFFRKPDCSKLLYRQNNEGSVRSRVRFPVKTVLQECESFIASHRPAYHSCALRFTESQSTGVAVKCF